MRRTTKTRKVRAKKPKGKTKSKGDAKKQTRVYVNYPGASGSALAGGDYKNS